MAEDVAFTFLNQPGEDRKWFVVESRCGSGFYLTLRNGGSSNGVNIILSNELSSAAHWTFNSTENGDACHLTNRAGGSQVALKKHSARNGVNIHGWNNSTNPNTQWDIETVTNRAEGESYDSWVRIVNKRTGSYLGMNPKRVVKSGANIEQQKLPTWKLCHWKIVSVDESESKYSPVLGVDEEQKYELVSRPDVQHDLPGIPSQHIQHPDQLNKPHSPESQNAEEDTRTATEKASDTFSQAAKSTSDAVSSGLQRLSSSQYAHTFMHSFSARSGASAGYVIGTRAANDIYSSVKGLITKP